ncbi:hypothetical protein V5O48_013952 [Marasmius crinis-equi]|uniref:SWIM-type domain-containing protein n=1 Tax=Marasmius crinis-equi TaxID=585013 RepID=A0ABR3EYP1_9AGAR
MYSAIALQPPTGFKTWAQAGAAAPLPAEPKPEVKHLLLTNEQRTQLCNAYLQDSTLLTFKADPSQQKLATEKLAELSLTPDRLESLESRWSAQWSTSWKTKGGLKKRTLYQCGYDTEARQKYDSKTQRAQERSSTNKTWERRVPYGFTGCLGHVEVVENVDTKVVERIWGIFKHNEQCQKSVLTRLPSIPVHEHVWEVALSQMAIGASLTAIQDTNQRMARAKQYRGMESFDPTTSNVRYLLLPTDSSTLYSKYGHSLGINVKVPPQYNISYWLDPSSTNYKPEIARAIFHYNERAEAGDRFEVCISTPEMDQAAWKYAHQAQLVLDGTFGVCTVRLLLFIALAIDSEGKGLPIALFLFSAPTGNRATHAGYNTAILEKVLRKWEGHLSSQRPGSERFTPRSTITDTDTKERAALVKVWPNVVLLLCKFHVRQCWTNNRKKVVGGGDKAKPNFWKDHVRNHLRGLESLLLDTTTHQQAQDLIKNQYSYFDAIIADKNADATRAAEAGKKQLSYLNTNWMDIAMWRSWSKWGRLTVASLLKIKIEKVASTTNHLESFNGILKRKHLARWFHSGHRLRFDFLILLLCNQILPGIYNRRTVQDQHTSWLSERFKPHAGGKDLVDVRRNKELVQKSGAGICWWASDETRDQRANAIVSLRQITCQVGNNPDSFLGKALSSKSNELVYSLSLYRDGRGSCSCLDFQENGGACKHLRAMRIVVDYSLSLSKAAPLHYPSSLPEGLSVRDAALSQIPATPPAPAPLPSTIDFSGIQASVQDHTALNSDEDCFMDGQEDEDTVGDLEDEVCETVVPPENLDVEQRRAINLQLQAKIRFEATQLLPRLHGLNNLLEDLPNVEGMTMDELYELHGVVENMQARIQALRGGTSAGSTEKAMKRAAEADVDEERGRRAKRSKHRTIRAPSWEKRQERHTSNSTS